MNWGWDWMKKRKMAKTEHSLYLFLTVDTTGPVASSSCHYNLLVWTDATFELWAKKQTNKNKPNQKNLPNLLCQDIL